ncbi:MAG TPA: alpha-glucan family phosphorylase [Anaerolineae bacterium]|nr:alpha-glucan family phosphorylase [Anaerolineae bacterium]HQH38608.1 alpha-glucan family phosphorylase [Anaerolineae bacterium]
MKPKPMRTFSIIPALPEPLKPLWDLAYNLRWAWKHDIIELFRRLDSDLWEKTNHNPVLMLGTIDQSRLEAVVEDVGFMAHLKRVTQYLEDHLHEKSTAWFARTHGETRDPLIAYFSFEFGITECLTIFAGGLGILSGDHIKSASDLGLPLVGVGLLYQQGYFRQYLNQAGWQQEAYENNHFDNLPLRMACDAQGNPLTVGVEFPGRTVTARIWRADVGRTPIYLLDTNIPDNTRPEDRDITDQLYGGDQDTRIRQEILLGIGGYRALQVLGLNPTVYHMNEGHSAFLGLERTRCLMDQYKVSFYEAREAASAGLIFTTHTPVPAGHDRFPPPMMEYYFKDYVTHKLNLPWNDFLALGRQNPYDYNEPFCMTILALRMSAYSNGVSRLHGEVTRQMWEGLWPGVPQNEIPISHVTNGVHILSWISRDMKVLYDRYLGPRWREEPADQSVWQRAGYIAAEELWSTHERRRERLVAFARNRLQQQLEQRGAAPSEVEAAGEALDPEALTIGFARRFATYKRATLLLRDPERLARLLNDPQRPVQIIFAGKAHPHDNPGKELIQKIVALARQDVFRSRLVFLEDYDMTVARYMVQGVDVWLNTPRRPREASGTSGMKAAANGVLNVSILDGWWEEAYTPSVGWAIGRGEIYDNMDVQDQVEAEALYDLLERDVIPMFYDRGRDNLPRRWIGLMKNSIGALSYFFNTNRMVAEYTNRFYMPAAKRYDLLTADDLTGAKSLAAWKLRLYDNWSHIRIEKVNGDLPTEIKVGDKFVAQAEVHLGELSPEDVWVELYIGLVNPSGEIVKGRAEPMHVLKRMEEGVYLFEATTQCTMSGLHGYTVRVLPQHPDAVTPFLPGFIKWAE